MPHPSYHGTFLAVQIVNQFRPLTMWYLVPTQSRFMFFSFFPEATVHVESVVNGLAKLPCELKQGSDVVTLVIWYRADTDTPLYTLDARGRSLDQATHWADEHTFQGRAYLRLSDDTAYLALESVGQQDSGTYKCRVDFKKSPTRNFFVNLTVAGKFFSYCWYLKEFLTMSMYCCLDCTKLGQGPYFASLSESSSYSVYLLDSLISHVVRD